MIRFLASILAVFLSSGTSYAQNPSVMMVCESQQIIKTYLERYGRTETKKVDLLKALNNEQGKRACVYFNLHFSNEPVKVDTVSTDKGDFPVYKGHATHIQMGDSFLPINPNDFYFVPDFGTGRD